MDHHLHYNNDDHINIISKVQDLKELDQSDIQSLDSFSKKQLISIIKAFNSNMKYINEYLLETTKRR
jgi:hypothetical protein